jgi:hypothetical protein
MNTVPPRTCETDSLAFREVAEWKAAQAFANAIERGDWEMAVRWAAYAERLHEAADVLREPAC